jgi:hypothetical protein
LEAAVRSTILPVFGAAFVALAAPALATPAPALAAPASDQEVFTGPTVDVHPQAGPVLYVGRGYDAGGSVTVFADSAGPPSDVPVRISFGFPAGLSMGSEPPYDADTGRNLPCTTVGPTVTCTLTVDSIGDVGFAVHAAANLAVGTRTAITVTAEPIGQPDADPSNNVTQAPVGIWGDAALHFSVHVPTNRITRGEPILATVTVRNDGPDPAPNLYLSEIALAQPKSVERVTKGDRSPALNGWANEVHLPVLPPGQSVTISLRITGLRVGARITVSVGGQADVQDTAPYCLDRACNAAAAAQLTVIAPAAPSATPPPSGATAHTAPIANTGTPAGDQLLAGLALVLLGAGLAAAGRRRVVGRHRLR